jgi:hypothetical protein
MAAIMAGTAIMAVSANPFHKPGEVPPAIVEINLSLNDGEEPADQPALSS